ncbi:MAG: hypothetical protein KBS59_06510, partial [Clostridiales bacterium]|nr:hypothetical protein [Clostridiales bacterium]
MNYFNAGVISSSPKDCNYDFEAYRKAVKDEIKNIRFISYEQYENYLSEAFEGQKLPHPFSDEQKARRRELQTYALDKISNCVADSLLIDSLYSKNISDLKEKGVLPKSLVIDRHAGEFLVYIGMKYGVDKMKEETEYFFSNADPAEKMEKLTNYLMSALEVNNISFHSSDRKMVDDFIKYRPEFYMMSELGDITTIAKQFGLTNQPGYNELNAEIKKASNFGGTVLTAFTSHVAYICDTAYTFVSEKDIIRAQEENFDVVERFSLIRSDNHTHAEFMGLSGMLEGANAKAVRNEVMESSLNYIREQHPDYRFVKAVRRMALLPDKMKTLDSIDDVTKELNDEETVYIVDGNGKFVQTVEVNGFYGMINAPSLGNDLLDDPTSKGFKSAIGDLYNAVDEVDPALMISSTEYRTLKAQLKSMKSLGDDDIKNKSEKFMTELGKLRDAAQKYIDSKADPSVNKSIRTYDRLSAATKVLNATRVTLEGITLRATKS